METSESRARLDEHLTRDGQVSTLHRDLDQLIEKIHEIDPDGKNGLLEGLDEYILFKIQDPDNGLPVLQQRI